MENGSNEYFDMITLLKHGDLDIRRVVAAESSLSVDEYFNRLSRFICLAPDVSSSLKKFIDRDGDKDACKNLDAMTGLLASLGCDKFVPDFFSILDIYGKGDWRLAATHAKKIVDDFDEFHTRIILAKRTKCPAAPPEGQETEPSLKKLLKQLDDEESNRKLSILVVDDSPVILRSVSSLLAGDYKVYALSNPTRLEEVLQKTTPELFLLDYQMPEINGFDLVPVIRSFKEHKDTPVIFLTSAGTIDHVSAARALGACEYVMKPFDPDTLRAKIAKHIVRKKAFNG